MRKLRYEERQQIMFLTWKWFSLRSVATMLERNVSTISRELKRNAVKGEYTAKKADMKSYQRRHSCKVQSKKIRLNNCLEQYVRKKLENGWSPEQIAWRWNIQDSSDTISYMSIYRYVYSKFGYWLWYYLHSQRHKPRKRKQKLWQRWTILHRTFIDERPDYINYRERLGDREADTIVGTRKDKHCIVTLVERKSRYLKAQMLENKKAHNVYNAISSLVEGHDVQSMTFDNGHEFAFHYKLWFDTYFCHPYSSREKGQVEYTNKLIRRYIAKKANLSSYDDSYVQLLVHVLNHTPRKCLWFRTPFEVYFWFSVAIAL